MSNLLNELSVTMKEISKLNSRLAELESKELELGLKILSNEQAKKALTAEGIIVGDEIINYYPDTEEFGFQPMPVFANKINFDEPEPESKNPFKAGDKVNHEMYPSRELAVIFVSGGLVVTDDESIEGPFSRFSFANKE